MNNEFCDITVVLDRSGSMETIQEATIKGFNTFIREQQQLAGKCNMSLVQFDDEYDTEYTGIPIKDVEQLNAKTFVPRGMTALFDAIGRTINATGKRLSALEEVNRPSKVLFVIITDGAENASKEFSRTKIFEMIGHQKSVYQWDFIFLGANQDAIAVGRELNINYGSTMTYAANSAGTQNAFISTSNYTTRSRSAGHGVASTFSDEDRKKQEEAGVKS